MKRVAVLATLNTKGDEARFVAECLSSRGYQPWLVDLSLIGGGSVSGDMSREAIAQAVGRTPQEVERLQRADAMQVVADGATRILLEMVNGNELHGAIGLGGGTGTWLASAV